MPASAEAISWREGNIWVWTGSASASAEVAYAVNMNLTPAIGFANRQTMGGKYSNHETGRIVQYQIGLVASQHWTLFKMFSSGAMAHLHFAQSSVNGSAGIYLYSGRINSMPLIGQQGATMQWQMAGYANEWSSYGG